jgi:hypothetical protein
MSQIELDKIEKTKNLSLKLSIHYSTDCRLSRVGRACDERKEYET